MRKGTRVWTAVLFACLLAVALPASAAAEPGDLDITFSDDGKVITNVTDGFDFTLGLAIQNDGKIVTAGEASGSGGRFYVVRYLDDGTLDPSFGGDGVVLTNFTPGGDYGYDVTIDNNDKILVVGGVGGSGGRIGLARYDPVDGDLDTSFGGGDGKVTTNFSAGDDYAYNVLVDANGKIVAVGRGGGSGGRFAVARYDDDGTLDTTFGSDGKVTTNFTAGEDYADDVALVGVDTIVVSGTANFLRESKFALAQYDSTGQLDPTFGGDGKVTTNLARGIDGAWGVAVQSGVGIVATGPAGGRVGLVRYTLTGALDNTFGGGDGIVRTNWSSGTDWTDEIALDGAGRIVVVGVSNVAGSDAKVGLGRYAANGILDSAFGNGGVKQTNLTGGLDYGFDVQIDANQKIVATGAVRNGGQSFVTRHLSE